MGGNPRDPSGCKRCICNKEGTVNETQCNQTNGHCICKQNWSGDKCYKCVPGKYGKTCANDCDCHEKNSNGNSCDQLTGQCTCVLGWPYYCGRRCTGAEGRNRRDGCNCEINGVKFYDETLC